MNLYDELLELVLAYSNKQVKYLAQWIVDYKKRDDKKEAELRLGRALYVNRFHRMVDEYSAAKGKEKAARQEELFEYYLSFVQAIIPNRYRFAIDEQCKVGNWRDASSTLRDIEREIEALKFESEYEKLVTDTEYLIEQLVAIMKVEYAKRQESAKRAIAEYSSRHGAMLERLDLNLAEARDALGKMDRGELPPEDKREVEGLLRGKIGEMEDIKSREIEEARRTMALAEEAEKAYSALERVILSIERERDLIEERKKYQGLLNRLEIETSEIDRMFSGLRADLDANIEKAKESMEILTSTFDGRFLSAISDQERVNRILEGDAPAAEGDGELPRRDYYEDILKILKSMKG